MNAPVQADASASLRTRPRVLWVGRMVFSSQFRLREVEIARQLARDIDIFALDCTDAVMSTSRINMRARFLRKPFQVLEEGPLTRFTTRIAFSSGPPLNKLAARFNNARFAEAARHFGCTHVFHANPWSVLPPERNARNYHAHFDLIDDFFGDWPANRLGDARRRFLARAMQRCDTLSACSLTLCDIAEKYSGRKAAYAPNAALRERLENVAPADVEAVKRRYNLHGRFVVGFICNHTVPFDGMEVIVKAWLAAARPDATLLIIGPGSDKFTRTLPETPGIVAVGAVPPDQVAAYFHACDAGVHPFMLVPVCEPALPLNVVEFSVCGKPVLTNPLLELRRQALPNVRFTKADTVEAWTAALRDPASFAPFDQAALRPKLAPLDWAATAAVIRKEMGL